MDSDKSKNEETNEGHIDVSEQVPPVENKEDVFKKPCFIGPRRGPKVFKKPFTSNNVAPGNSDHPKVDEDSSSPILKSELQKYKNNPLPYTEPVWKGTTNEMYFLEELKSGVIQSTTSLQKKSLLVFGRIDCCDVVMAHPTVSRYHAVLQYGGVPDGEEEKGFYLYDLDSTHGTFLNKSRLKPNVYARVRVGHIIKFGCSTRFFLLQGPEYDQEEESDMTFTELKEKKKQEMLEKKRKEEEEIKLQEEEEERQLKLIEERGISWGLGEDADEEGDLSENPYAVTTNEEMYCDDPKKALRLWFERVGEEMELETEQVEKGMMACKIILPLDDEKGQGITVESNARNKKEAQVQCCLEACRLIDKMGLFQQAKQEAKRRQRRNWEENDYYDSDEDSFLDRTGDLENKRQKRMRKVGKVSETVETYESLMAKHSVVVKELADARMKLDQVMISDQSSSASENEEVDALDAFMKNLKHDKPGKLDIKIAKEEVGKLEKEENHLRKLINIVKPTSMPELKPYVPVENKTELKIKNQKRKIVEADPETEFPEDDNGPLKTSEPTVKVKDSGSSLLSKEKPEKPHSIPSVSQHKTEENRAKIKTSKKPKTVEEDDTKMDEDFTNLIWQPPKGQTGDGRTSLNDKFGY